MKKITSFLKSRKWALIISILYVVTGTLAVCSAYGSDPLYGEWTLYALLITFPVSVLSFVCRYTDPSIWPILLIQFMMFLSTFFVLSLFIKSKPDN
ncbi:Uncharacterised protein [Chryseobacterium gleum]|uniref:Uncharacterized protein n=2 Tax=Chryseobacterium gleum TaxID=250 RepID=A0A448B0W7_CHRGE|nr:hypothetical protein [Chryseobacterium gleum]EFK33607.1 hypothetical protein HMPREF0204_12675 [Chryseobacterium gleum ATCC 35910]QQY34372.1 hypothetical protein I6I60_11620 [Chryseobacterium gleum]VEE06718.1 Uncharacterised protein [Chryseobacterium gleum]